MKIFRSVMNAAWGVPVQNPAVMPAKTILSMATEQGYRLMDENGGKIEQGSKADFITIRLMQPHLYPTGNLVNTASGMRSSRRCVRLCRGRTDPDERPSGADSG